MKASAKARCMKPQARKKRQCTIVAKKPLVRQSDVNQVVDALQILNSQLTGINSNTNNNISNLAASISNSSSNLNDNLAQSLSTLNTSLTDTLASNVNTIVSNMNTAGQNNCQINGFSSFLSYAIPCGMSRTLAES